MTKTIILTAWLMLGPGDHPTSERLKDWLYETRSNCQESARYLATVGYPRRSCVPVQVKVTYK